MQHVLALDVLRGPQMESRSTSMALDDDDLGNPQALLAQLQTLQMRAAQLSPANSLDIQLALLNRADSMGSGGIGVDLFAAAAGANAAAIAAAAAAAPKRASVRQRRNEEQIRRTVYINDVDHAVTETDLATFFAPCGPIVDCRICGDANSAMRFAFIEFRTEVGAATALSRSGAVLGSSVIRVSPSKTAIVPVNNQYLPRSEEERAAVARTVYVANIHRAVERDALHAFFLNLCGPVSKIRLLGDSQHDTKIAFVEFATADGAAAALRCTGALLGPLPIRVSASKTPVRTEGRRAREAAMPATPFSLMANTPMGGMGLPLNGLSSAGSMPLMSTGSLTTGASLSPFAAVDAAASDAGVGLGAPGLTTAASMPANFTLPPGFNSFLS